MHPHTPNLDRHNSCIVPTHRQDSSQHTIQIFCQNITITIEISTIYQLTNLTKLNYIETMEATSELTDPQFCFVYQKFSFEQWVIYLTIVSAALVFIRICYQLITQYPRTYLFNKLLYILILFWISTTTSYCILALQQYNSLTSPITISNSAYIGQQTYIDNIHASKTIFLLYVISEVTLQSILVFFYAYLLWRFIAAIRDSDQDESRMGPADKKLKDNLGCLLWSFRILVAVGVLRFVYLFFLIPIVNSETQKRDSLSTFSTVVGAVDPELLLFPAILLCVMVQQKTFKQSLTFDNRHRLGQTLKQLPIIFSLRAFQMIILFYEPHWYTYKEQKCNVNTNQYQPYDVSSVAMIFSLLLNTWLLYQLFNGLAIRYQKDQTNQTDNQNGLLPQNQLPNQQ